MTYSCSYFTIASWCKQVWLNRYFYYSYFIKPWCPVSKYDRVEHELQSSSRKSWGHRSDLHSRMLLDSKCSQDHLTGHVHLESRSVNMLFKQMNQWSTLKKTDTSYSRPKGYSTQRPYWLPCVLFTYLWSLNTLWMWDYDRIDQCILILKCIGGSDHKHIFKVHTVLSIAKEVQLDIE